MALHRRTLRDLLAAPLFDEAQSRATVLLLATGSDYRSTLHTLGVSVPGAQRRAHDHVVIALTRGESDVSGEIHIVGIGEEESEHPVTRQLALRAQGVLASPSTPRVCKNLLDASGADAVEAYRALMARIFRRIEAEHEKSRSSAPPEDDYEDAPPSVGTRRCELALLGVTGITAQELLTALDTVMLRGRYRRCAIAGGGRAFVLLRGGTGAGLRVADDRVGSAVELAVELARELDTALLVATATAEQAFDEADGLTETKMSWSLEAVSATGTGVAYRDYTSQREPGPDHPLDERLCHHIARHVFEIEPEPNGLAIHYERG